MGRFLSVTSCWRSLWEHCFSNRWTRLPLIRQTVKPSTPDRSLSGRPRKGFAAKELLLVTAMIGGAAVGLRFLDPDNSHKRDPVRAGELATFLQREVPLGDAFVCFVSVAQYSSPGSHNSPYYMCRMRFAHRNPDPFLPFVLEIMGDTTPRWHNIATCRAWSVMSPEAALDYVHEHGQTPLAPSELTEPERFTALINRLSSRMKSVTNLEEPLWRCVPMALKESGIMLITGEWSLHYVHEFQGFPLTELVAAIRTAAQDDNWTTDDPTARLTQKNVGNPALTDDDEQAIAQAFVYRLLGYLPQDEAENSNAGIDRGQGMSKNCP